MTYFAEAKQGKVRVFTSFDFDNDVFLRDALVGQSKNPDSPFEIADWSLSKPVPGDWKEKVRTRMKQTKQVIVICGKHTHTATGVSAEVQIARELEIPYFLLQGYKDGNCTKPSAAQGHKMYDWTWENLKKLIGGQR